MLPLILQMFWLVLCYNTYNMEQVVVDYPNVYQSVHNEDTRDRVKDMISENKELIYQYKVKDEWVLLCAYTYAQWPRYTQKVDRIIHKD